MKNHGEHLICTFCGVSLGAPPLRPHACDQEVLRKKLKERKRVLIDKTEECMLMRRWIEQRGLTYNKDEVK